MNLTAMMSIASLSATGEPQGMLMAAKAMKQMRAEGANALQLIQKAAPPPSDGVRGTLLNVMA
jgi:hypothetical protein